MKKETLGQAMVVSDITCDICNKSVVPEFAKRNLSNLDDFSAFAQLKAEFGYGSKRDGENMNFDLCEQCFDKLLVKVEELKSISDNKT
ncbi:MAG: hypothetical protein WEA82_09920 [Idiomarina sp.]